MGVKAELVEAQTSNLQSPVEWEQLLHQKGVIGYVDYRNQKHMVVNAMAHGKNAMPHNIAYKVFNKATFKMNPEYKELANETATYTVPEAIPIVYAREFVREAFEAPTARKIFPTDTTLVNKEGNTLTIPHLNHLVSGVGIAAEDWSSSNVKMETGEGIQVKPLKYGVRVEITQEAIEDSWANWIGEAGRSLGEAYANYEDRMIYKKGLYDGLLPENKVAKSTDFWSDNVGWADNIENDITNGIEALELAYKKPSHIIVNSRVMKYIRRHPDFLNYNVYGGESPIHEIEATEMRGVAVPGKIFGLEVVQTTNLATSMGFKTASAEDNICIVDATKSVRICEKRPLTVKQNPYADPDMEKTIVVGTARVAPFLMYADAGYWLSNLVE